MSFTNFYFESIDLNLLYPLVLCAIYMMLMFKVVVLNTLDGWQQVFADNIPELSIWPDPLYLLSTSYNTIIKLNEGPKSGNKKLYRRKLSVCLRLTTVFHSENFSLSVTKDVIYFRFSRHIHFFYLLLNLKLLESYNR